MNRSFTIERKPLPGSQYRAQPDDAAELRALAELVRNMPRDWIQSWPDLFNAMRRVGGKMAKIAERLEVVPPKERPARPLRPAQSPRLMTEQVRFVSSRGRRVRVVERSTRQLEMSL